MKLPGRTFNDGSYSAYTGLGNTARAATANATSPTRIGSPLIKRPQRDPSPIKSFLSAHGARPTSVSTASMKSF